MRNIADVTGGKPITICSQYISGVCVVCIVAFIDIPGKKEEVLFICPEHTTGLFIVLLKTEHK
jgi:hypothetical protein